MSWKGTWMKAIMITFHEGLLSDFSTGDGVRQWIKETAALTTATPDIPNQTTFRYKWFTPAPTDGQPFYDSTRDSVVGNIFGNHMVLWTIAPSRSDLLIRKHRLHQLQPDEFVVCIDERHHHYGICSYRTRTIRPLDIFSHVLPTQSSNGMGYCRLVLTNSENSYNSSSAVGHTTTSLAYPSIVASDTTRIIIHLVLCDASVFWYYNIWQGISRLWPASNLGEVNFCISRDDSMFKPMDQGCLQYYKILRFSDVFIFVSISITCACCLWPVC